MNLLVRKRTIIAENERVKSAEGLGQDRQTSTLSGRRREGRAADSAKPRGGRRGLWWWGPRQSRYSTCCTSPRSPTGAQTAAALEWMLREAAGNQAGGDVRFVPGPVLPCHKLQLFPSPRGSPARPGAVDAPCGPLDTHRSCPRGRSPARPV